MKAVVLSFTQAGTALGCRVAACLRGGGWDVRQASLKKVRRRPGTGSCRLHPISTMKRPRAF